MSNGQERDRKMADGEGYAGESEAETRELVPIPENGLVGVKPLDIYNGASTLVLTPDETEILLEPVKDENVDIRPDGLLYLPQVFVRDRLNRAFGVCQWAIMELDIGVKNNTMSYDGALIVRGKFVSRGTGEAHYIENNPKQSWASVKESAKSDTIARCCKDLGIAKETWQPRWCEKWIAKYAIKVKVETRRGLRIWWRHKDAKPFEGEIGLAKEGETDGSNNNQPAADPSTYTGNALLLHEHVAKIATEGGTEYGAMMAMATAFMKKDKDTGKMVSIRGRQRIEDLSDARLDVLVKKLKLGSKKSGAKKPSNKRQNWYDELGPHTQERIDHCKPIQELDTSQWHELYLEVKQDGMTEDEIAQAMCKRADELANA